MWVFYVLLLVPIAIQHFTIGGHKYDYEKKNRLAFAVFFVLWITLVMLRHESVGNDTRNYISFFENFSKLSWRQITSITVEGGFAFWNKLVSVFTKDPQVYLAITAIVIGMMIYPTYRRLCTDSSLTIVLFCLMSTFVMIFSGTRQMIAVGIGMIAYEFTRKKKLIPFILLVILATTIHTSGFLIAFIYPVYHIRIKKSWLIAIIPMLALIFAFNEPIFKFLAVFIENYTEYDLSIYRTGAYAMLILFALLAFFSFIIPDETKLDKETVGLRNLLLLSLIIQMFVPLHNLAMRMNYYFIIFIPLLIPRIIELSREKYRHVAIAARHIMVIFFLAYFFYNAYTGTGNLNVFPYHFFWENVQ